MKPETKRRGRVWQWQTVNKRNFQRFSERACVVSNSFADLSGDVKPFPRLATTRQRIIIGVEPQRAFHLPEPPSIIAGTGSNEAFKIS